VNFFRLGIKIAVALAGQYDLLGIWNPLGEDVGAAAVRHVADDKMIVVANEDQRGDFDVVEPIACIMLLTRQHVPE